MWVNRGSGRFTLWKYMRDPGDMHLSYYPVGGGQSFASVYFASVAPVAASSQQPEQTKDVPRGWTLMGNQPQAFCTGLDMAMMHDGAPSAYLASKTADEFKGFGTLGQYFTGKAYLGKRIRLRAAVRAQDVKHWAGLWMRVDEGEGKEQKSAAFDNMQSRPIKGTKDWAEYDIVLDVPINASGIGMGILVDGPGEVWLNDVTIDVVGHDVPTTDFMASKGGLIPNGPVNLNLDN